MASQGFVVKSSGYPQIWMPTTEIPEEPFNEGPFEKGESK